MCVARKDAHDGRERLYSVDAGAAMTRGAGSLVPGGAKGVNMQVVGGAKETGLTQATASTTELNDLTKGRREESDIPDVHSRPPGRVPVGSVPRINFTPAHQFVSHFNHTDYSNYMYVINDWDLYRINMR